MATNALEKNIAFWHWFPEMLVEGLTPEQLAWQPEGHDSSVQFATWHCYRAEDEIVHALVIKQPTVYASEAWAGRLPAPAGGITPFGNGMSREQIGALQLDMPQVLAYARAVGDRIGAYLRDLPDPDAAVDVALPFFTQVYPSIATLTKAEVIAFFSIGHVSEHLGEVQFLKGLLGMKGAPL